MNTMKGEYFVLAWMPHRYPKSILNRSESQSCMLVAAIIVSLCLGFYETLNHAITLRLGRGDKLMCDAMTLTNFSKFLHLFTIIIC
jgi:hypothetical protein